ncbi:hypothetical protein PLIIFM63780_006832 [Purpureocillium lilacinum]|nr:hypothetical protein PLIIFM63780_006832 [Purpureocillium lilacinum]
MRVYSVAYGSALISRRRRLTGHSRIENLEARLAAYENSAQAQEHSLDAEGHIDPEPLARESNDGLDPAFREAHQSSTVILDPEPSEPLSGSTISADSSLSSSYTFGSRVQRLFQGSRPAQQRDDVGCCAGEPCQSSRSTTRIFDLPSFPSEKEALELLETQVFYIGYTQNHVDVREISDKIGLLFANKEDPAVTESLWTLEILLICANARLFKGDFGSGAHATDNFPGYSLFSHVCDRIPSLSQLYSFGRSGVEVLALVAVYLVNINRKEEAYVYISTALRLAISHGFHKKSAKSRLLQSEVNHTNRLWWSVYLQERCGNYAVTHSEI